MRLFLHTVGTSILNNALSEKQRRLLLSQSNEKQLDDAAETIAQQAVALATKPITELRNCTKKAAELKALAKLCPDGCKQGDLHFLLHTDTHFGQLAAEALAIAFEKCGFVYVQLINIEQLNTASKTAFDSGIKWLIHWCEKELPPYQESGYEIIFSLNGGFKSMLGYMNTIGLFYADRIVYVFEGSDELIEIPRLPITLHADEIEKNAGAFLLLSANGVLPFNKIENEVKSVEDLYLELADDMIGLSPVGELVWGRVKKRVLTEKLIPLPGIKFEDSFLKDFRNAQRDPVKLQETLAKVAAYIITERDPLSSLKKDGGVLYEEYNNKKSNGVPIAHFRINQETRVSCTFRNNALRLRQWGAHDFVNDNP